MSMEYTGIIYSIIAKSLISKGLLNLAQDKHIIWREVVACLPHKVDKEYIVSHRLGILPARYLPR